MKAQIIAIDQPKASRNGDVTFYRVKFKLEDGTFAMSDIVPRYRNFAYWRSVLQSGVGTWIDNVFLKSPGKIDADSRIWICKSPAPTPDPQFPAPPPAARQTKLFK